MAPEVGQSLREARIRRGIELSQVEQATKIRVRYLRAMEEDRWEVLPGPAYARGFLRTYARFLELDEGVLVQEYRRRHERVEEVRPPAEPVLRKGGVGKLRTGPSGAVLAGLLAAAVLGVVVVLGLTGGSRNGGHGAERGAGPKTGSASPTTPTTTLSPAQVALRLRATGTVWVCLVDERDRALIDGVTLTSGEARGPFQARSFKVTFGNGYMRMDVDQRPIEVPQAAEPLGYQISSRGVRQLDSSSRPTCV